MYAGNRLKSERKRSPKDYYPTPIELVRATIKKISLFKRKVEYVLDPGCGDGVWGQVVGEIYPAVSLLVGVDLEIKSKLDWYDKLFKQDYVEQYLPGITFDLIVGNPPYSLNEPFVLKSLSLLSSDGVLAFLMPLGFLGSQRRSVGLFRENPPTDVWVSSRRPSFFSSGGNRKTTDSFEYAIYVWRKSSIGEGTKLDWLNWDYKK